jgi:hypothetical protein
MINTKGLFVNIAGSGTHGAFGAVGAVGDGGPATAAALGGPPSVAVDSQGNLFIADEANFRIREVVAPWQAPVNVACG